MRALVLIVLGFAAGWFRGRRGSVTRGASTARATGVDWRTMFRNGEREDRL